MADPTPERLLIAEIPAVLCSFAVPDTAVSRFPASQSWAAEDLAALLELARAHGVEGAVLENLLALSERMGGSTSVPGGGQERERQIHSFLWWELQSRQVIELLRSAGFSPPLVLKGGALKYVAYPRPWLRPSDDLDLLLPEKELDAAVSVLLSHGFVYAMLSSRRPWSTLKGYHVALMRGDFRVELHRAVDPGGWFRGAYEELSARAEPLPSLGLHALAPGKPDLWGMLLVHALKHSFDLPLRGWVDFRVFRQSSPCVPDLPEPLRQSGLQALPGTVRRVTDELFGSLEGETCRARVEGLWWRGLGLKAHRTGLLPSWSQRSVLARKAMATLAASHSLRTVAKAALRYGVLRWRDKRFRIDQETWDRTRE